MLSLKLFTLASFLWPLAVVLAVEPAAVYDGGFGDKGDILLKIGNGGAGQSGLVKELADAFIKQSVKGGADKFRVAWYKSDTTESINYLKDGTVDVAITYSPVAEKIAMDQGIAQKPSYYIFRDHFLLVGPPSTNPAKISKESDITTIFSTLYAAGEAANTDPPVRFLSRYDKSATNIKDSELFIQVGQVPWATKYTTWYHQYIAYPIQALTAAALLKEYTITDRGTLLSVDSKIRDQVTIYKSGGDKDPKDPLLNPAHLIIGAKSKNNETAHDFAEWLVGKDGQKVIKGFKKGEEFLYSGAP